jgi:hypothetical protein
MSRRSRYKRRVVQRSRDRAKATKANTPAILDAAANYQRPKSPPSKAPRRREKLVDRLGRKRPTTRMTIAGLAVGIAGVGISLYFGLWPSSPGPVIGKPIPTTTGGQNPTPLFRGRSCTSVQQTELILYSLDNAVKCASPLKGTPIIVIGSSKPTSYCASSYVMPRTGAYRCEIQVDGINTIADPCFGVDRGQVECELPNGTFGLLNVINIGNPKPYRPSLSEVGRRYPFRLELANGLSCTWNWLPFIGHTGGGWVCGNPRASIEFQPVRYHRFLKGRDALYYNGALVTGTNYMSYAEDLAQGSQSTWSVLLEGPNNPGRFHRVSVAQAWY